MKKLRSKQKLVCSIAIILVAIILAVVITINIIKNNSQVASEGYFSTTANANSNLVASYIKSGITIGGITGTLESLNTFDATAIEEDIAWGKTAYVKGEKITGTRVDTVAQAKEYQKVFEENTYLRDDYGNRVKVPAGFKIAEDSATSVTGGVVIEDVTAGGENSTTIGSQFVWVPVGDVITDNNGSKTTIILGRYDLRKSPTSTTPVQTAEEWDSTNFPIVDGFGYDCRELANSTYGVSSAKNLEDFITKTLSNKGYYIGRYEVGDANATSSARTDDEGINNPITCKSGVYPYNYITQSEASSLCQNMYSSSKFESDLINSYAWDTAIVFIQEFSGDNDYAKQVALQNTLAKCGEAHSGSNYDVRCNIYDLAGNTQEWTTEIRSANDNNVVGRSGYFVRSGDSIGNTYSPAHRGANSITTKGNEFSARSILYL